MIKILELFGGIGAPRKALQNLGYKVNTIDYVEIDKDAVKSYNAIFSENFKPQDILNWNKDVQVDMIFHGSPCQDFSIAGTNMGGDYGSGTRSSLLYETLRIVEKIKPKYVIWENVKNVISKKHKHNFDNYLSEMEKLGYTNYYQVLNAKDYGIPQNRERVFTISILGSWEDNGIGQVLYEVDDFNFPEKKILKLKLKDLLESEVEEKYYLTDKMMRYVLDMNEVQEGTKWEGRANNGLLNKDIALTIGVRSAEAQRGGVTNFIIDGLDHEIKVKDFKLLIKEATKKGYKEAYDGDSVNLEQPNSKTRRGRVGNQVAQTLTTSCNQGVVNNYKIRKLTPKECWRLMGFDDVDFEKASQVNSNAQLYKQAGNSIVVQVLEAIFRELLGVD